MTVRADVNRVIEWWAEDDTLDVMTSALEPSNIPKPLERKTVKPGAK